MCRRYACSQCPLAYIFPPSRCALPLGPSIDSSRHNTQIDSSPRRVAQRLFDEANGRGHRSAAYLDLLQEQQQFAVSAAAARAVGLPAPRTRQGGPGRSPTPTGHRAMPSPTMAAVSATTATPSGGAATTSPSPCRRRPASASPAAELSPSREAFLLRQEALLQRKQDSIDKQVGEWDWGSPHKMGPHCVV